jgi:kinesin family protein 2/24
MTGDAAYAYMIEDYRNEIISKMKTKYIDHTDDRITVLVRKRPIFNKELSKGELDCISIVNPHVIAHQTKTKVDLTKYLDNQKYEFDFTYDENNTSEDIYKSAIYPLS